MRRALSIVFIVIGGLLLIRGVVYFAGLQHEAFAYCSDTRPPAGAEPYEAAYHSSYVSALPISVHCVWNMKNETASDQIVSLRLEPTLSTYGGLILGVFGVVLLRRRGRVSRDSNAPAKVNTSIHG
jgi:hypothetical protein